MYFSKLVSADEFEREPDELLSGKTEVIFVNLGGLAANLKKHHADTLKRLARTDDQLVVIVDSREISSLPETVGFLESLGCTDLNVPFVFAMYRESEEIKSAFRYTAIKEIDFQPGEISDGGLEKFYEPLNSFAMVIAATARETIKDARPSVFRKLCDNFSLRAVSRAILDTELHVVIGEYLKLLERARKALSPSADQEDQ